MVVLDESKENFVLDVPYIEEVEAKLREEERKRTGRYLAVSVVLFLVGLGLYHTISNVASKASALISAAMVMFMYLLWLLYAAQRRKHQQKRADLTMEKQVTTVLENLNNARINRPVVGSHDNYVYSSSEEEVESRRTKKENKSKNEVSPKEYCNTNFEIEDTQVDDRFRKSSRGSDIFIRTYSIA